MTDALGGPAPKQAPLRVTANASRIGRARFIGHGAAFILIYLVVTVLPILLHQQTIVVYEATILGPQPPLVVHYEYMSLQPWLTFALSFAFALAWADLIVRRRHDRGRNGAFGLIWQALTLVSQVLHITDAAPLIVGWLDVALVVSGLWLFVVLVLLPGTRGPNRYGPDPRQAS